MSVVEPSPGARGRRALVALAVAGAAYVLSYVALRASWVEVWARDGAAYVIFPASAPALYYVYRPLSYADGALTGMRFHIGPHRPPSGVVTAPR